jgi:hypothetical protein
MRPDPFELPVGWDKLGGESRKNVKSTSRVAASQNRKTSRSRPAPAHQRSSIRAAKRTEDLAGTRFLALVGRRSRGIACAVMFVIE